MRDVPLSAVYIEDTPEQRHTCHDPFHDQPEAGDAFGDAEALAEAGDPVPPKAYRVETKHCTFETDDPHVAALAMKVFGDRAEMPAKE
ncbi:MAG: hypothetical protein GY946_01760 [bacterium]|nr:hypothetical protein [bacterium]